MTMLVPTTHATRPSWPPTRPAPQTQAQDIRGSAPRACADARARLLLLEPDPDVAALMTEVLRDEGYAVDHVAHPDALDATLGHTPRPPYDLILSAPYAHPLHAPYGWLDTLRAQVPGPLVICARYPAVFYAAYRQHGCAAYLEEPFAIATLVALVAHLVHEDEHDRDAPSVMPSTAHTPTSTRH